MNDDNIPPPVPKNTIGLIVFGGLGNRLYQVATAYSISLDKKKDLIMVGCAQNKHNQEEHYKDTIFRKIKYDFRLGPYYTWIDMEYTYLLGFGDEYIQRCITNLNYQHIPRFYIHNPYHYDICPDHEDNLFLSAYFQNSKFFDHHYNEIIDLFSPTDEIEQYIENKYTNEKLKNAVALHIRIEDDKDYEENNDLIVYYSNAIQILLNNNAKYFYIFSNRDINDQNLPFLKDIQYEIVNENEIISLYIISKCKIGCINNDSTFSWWGSYLNDNPDKIFITKSYI
jgi:hypothetical protein